MKKIIAAGLVLLPQLLFAGTECSVNEYPDHYYVYCLGDEISGPAPLHSSVTDQSTLTVPATESQPGKTTNAPQQTGRLAGQTVQTATPQTDPAIQAETNSTSGAITVTNLNPQVMPSMYRPPRSIFGKDWNRNSLANTTTTER